MISNVVIFRTDKKVSLVLFCTELDKRSSNILASNGHGEFIKFNA